MKSTCLITFCSQGFFLQNQFHCGRRGKRKYVGKSETRLATIVDGSTLNMYTTLLNDVKNLLPVKFHQKFVPKLQAPGEIENVSAIYDQGAIFVDRLAHISQSS